MYLKSDFAQKAGRINRPDRKKAGRSSGTGRKKKCACSVTRLPKKSLCVITGTRAEYGLLRPVLQKLLQSAVIEPRLVVTGAHLAPEFGTTVGEIEADGMPIAARIR